MKSNVEAMAHSVLAVRPAPLHKQIESCDLVHAQRRGRCIGIAITIISINGKTALDAQYAGIGHSALGVTREVCNGNVACQHSHRARERETARQFIATTTSTAAAAAAANANVRVASAAVVGWACGGAGAGESEAAKRSRQEKTCRAVHLSSGKKWKK